MKRRIVTVALLLPLLCPLAVGATNADIDPNGLTAPAPETAELGLVDWLDGVGQALWSWLRA